MRCGNRRRRRLLQQMSRSQTVHIVDSSSLQISRRNERNQIVYKIRISIERQMDKIQDGRRHYGRRSSNTYVDLDGRSSIGCQPSIVDVVVGGNNCDSRPYIVGTSTLQSVSYPDDGIH